MPEQGAIWTTLEHTQEGSANSCSNVRPLPSQPLPSQPFAAVSAPALGDQLRRLGDQNPLDAELISHHLSLQLPRGALSQNGVRIEEAVGTSQLSWPDTAFDTCDLFNNQPGAENMLEFETYDNTFDLPELQLQNTICTSDRPAIPCSTPPRASSYLSGCTLSPSGGYIDSTETVDASQSSSAPPLTGSNRVYTDISAPLPDPWRNNIQFTKTTIFNAFLTIALSLGFNLRDLVDANCLSTATQSPFYRPTTPQDDPRALLAAARLPFAPSNLQPTLPQILIPHHPFLDLIPFPALRASAVTLAAAMPHAFSMTELKKDVYIHGALVCWVGAQSGGTGQPWDTRSWEAAPWFLRKWRLLLDGENGDIWKSSKWWREARGGPPTHTSAT